MPSRPTAWAQFKITLSPNPRSPTTVSNLTTQIRNLLIENIPQAMIASTLGCDPSYISQVAAADAEEIRAARLAKYQGALDRDNKLDAVEDSLITRLQESIHYMHKPMELARVLQIVNSAKRRTSQADASPSHLQGAAVVTIVLPTNNQNPLIINQANNQVVQIGATPLVPLQMSALDRSLSNVQVTPPSSDNSGKAPNLLSHSEEDII